MDVIGEAGMCIIYYPIAKQLSIPHACHDALPHNSCPAVAYQHQRLEIDATCMRGVPPNGCLKRSELRLFSAQIWNFLPCNFQPQLASCVQTSSRYPALMRGGGVSGVACSLLRER